jgi:replication factor A1
MSLITIVVTVDQLKPGTLGHNLLVKVVSSQVVVDKARPDGSKVKVAEAVVGDHTGCITLTARNSMAPISRNTTCNNTHITIHRATHTHTTSV